MRLSFSYVGRLPTFRARNKGNTGGIAALGFELSSRIFSNTNSPPQIEHHLSPAGKYITSIRSQKSQSPRNVGANIPIYFERIQVA